MAVLIELAPGVARVQYVSARKPSCARASQLVADATIFRSNWSTVIPCSFAVSLRRLESSLLTGISTKSFSLMRLTTRLWLAAILAELRCGADVAMALGASAPIQTVKVQIFLVHVAGA